MATTVSEPSYTNDDKRKSQLRMTRNDVHFLFLSDDRLRMISTPRHTSIRNTNPFCNCGLSFNPYIGMPYHTLRNLLTNRCTTDTISSMSSLTLAVIIKTVPTAERHVTFRMRSKIPLVLYQCSPMYKHYYGCPKDTQAL